MKIYFSSLGCDKNLSDSEHMLALLSDAGYEFTDQPEEAEIAVVNSCCFIGDAKEESIGEILSLAKYKKEGKLQALIVTGCLSERYQEEFLTELPEVDGILGISSWDRIVTTVEEALKGTKPHLFDDKNRLCHTKKRVVTTGGHYAYLKIAEGCGKFCTYCVIPYVRGLFRSVPMEDLLKEAEELVSGGVQELILVAQETTLYGTDLYGRKALPELIRKLAEIPDLKWIRLLYCYPEEINDELIETLRTVEKAVPYLDIPIQHASDMVLKRMNRKTDQKSIRETVDKLRRAIPDITLRTTLITGFPGETEEDFETLKKFVSELRFERLGVFAYSKEEGTPASKMKDQVPKRIREKRRDAIMAIQQQISKEHLKSMIGKTLDVIVEGRLTDEEDAYIGRTVMDAPDVDGYIFFTSSLDLVSGTFVRVTVTDSNEYDLIGELNE